MLRLRFLVFLKITHLYARFFFYTFYKSKTHNKKEVKNSESSNLKQHITKFLVSNATSCKRFWVVKSNKLCVVTSLLGLITQYLRVRSHERWKLIPVWDFKPAWKQVLFTWNFIFLWTCVGISFRVVFTWSFITQNEISFLSKWPIWNPYPHWVSNEHAH